MLVAPLAVSGGIEGTYRTLICLRATLLKR